MTHVSNAELVQLLRIYHPSAGGARRRLHGCVINASVIPTPPRSRSPIPRCGRGSLVLKVSDDVRYGSWKRMCKLRCRPRHLPMVQNDEFRSKLGTPLLAHSTDEKLIQPCPARNLDLVAVSWVNTNIALFSYTRGLGEGPRNFVPWSSDEDDM
ncbi:hypothetical protein TNCV_2834881 [Trichonephila clavipes]|nr:hypothetical protein TNCV_2834881 [Trichonephila clavipes]